MQGNQSPGTLKIHWHFPDFAALQRMLQ